MKYYLKHQSTSRTPITRPRQRLLLLVLHSGKEFKIIKILLITTLLLLVSTQEGATMSTSNNAIRRIVKLPITGPYPTPDPFLFCVYHKDAYPAAFDESMQTPQRGNGADFNPDAEYRMYHGDRIPGFPSHPHRGFETITATMEGLIDHADSVGNAGRYGQGDVQWMTAGKGVVHSEMFPLIHMDKPNPLRLFQIWLNLPAKSKMVEPSFAMFWSKDVPIYTTYSSKASVTVWFGNYFIDDDNGKWKNAPPENSWANDPANDVAVLHIKVKPGGKLVLPKSKTPNVSRSLYLVEGSHLGVKINDQILTDNVQVELDSNTDVEITLPDCTDAGACVEFLMLQGKPIGEPVAQHGPFVMNTRDEIQQAFFDYQRTQFGGWPWDRDDMVFPRVRGKFSLLNGQEFEPTEDHSGHDENNHDTSCSTNN